MTLTNSRIIVIADDLTGALDCGLQFAKYGLSTAVAVTGLVPSSIDVPVFNTETRHVSAPCAERTLLDLASQLPHTRVYKKVDSTMRGNVGAELQALINQFPESHIVLCPAFPKGGRTVQASILEISGVPLSQTDFATDPRCPMTESHIPSILAHQTHCPIGTIPLGIVEQGVKAITIALEQHAEPILVVDALTDAHLRSLADSLLIMGPTWIPCGSAGLAEAWAQAFDFIPTPADCTHVTPGGQPILAVCGSRHPITRQQILYCVDHGGGRRLDLNAALEHTSSSTTKEIIDLALHALASGENTLLTTAFGPPARIQGSHIAHLVACLAKAVLREITVGGLYLTGGEMAMAVCQALDVAAIQVHAEVQPGLPLGRLLGGAYPDLPVITKAGGFGNQQTLLQAIQCLRPPSAKP